MYQSQFDIGRIESQAGLHIIKQELEEFESMNFIVYCVKYSGKATLWLNVLCAFCVMKSANAFANYMAYLILICRVL